MGEAKRKQSATQRLLARYPYCCFCGGETLATTREHYPPKALFDHSHRPDRLVVPACRPCNDLSRHADLITAIASRWSFSELGEVEAKDHMRLARRLKMQAPEIAAEWLEASSGTMQKRARRHLQQEGVPVAYENGYVTLGPKTLPHLHLFAHKLIVAIHFDQTKQLLTPSAAIFASFKTKEDIAARGLPNELKALLEESKGLCQGTFDTSDQFQYRTGQSADGNLFQFLARLRRGLMMFGFIVVRRELAPEIDYKDWLGPEQLKSILIDPRFGKR